MIYLTVGGAFLLLVAVLLLSCRKPEPEQQPEPDSFDVELYGRWPADHMETRL